MACTDRVQAEWRWSGFGQVVLGQSSGAGPYPQLDYTGDRLETSPESLLALQLNGDLGERAGLTAQLLSRGNRDYDPELAWAYLSWRATDGLSLKLGRQRIPFFVYSDALDVGFAYPWILPSQSTYYFLIQNYDGLSAAWSAVTGDWAHRVELHGGRFQGDLRLAGQRVDGEIDHLLFGLWEANYDDWLSLRLAYGGGDISLASRPLQGLFDGLLALDQAALVRALDARDDRGEFSGAAISLDRGHWLFGVEATQVRFSDTFVGDSEQLFVHVGYRLGDWTPFLSHSTRRVDARLGLLRDLPDSLPPPLRGGLTTLVNSEARDERYNSIGLRWDLRRNLALKLEYRDYDSALTQRPDAHLSAVALVFTY